MSIRLLPENCQDKLDQKFDIQFGYYFEFTTSLNEMAQVRINLIKDYLNRGDELPSGEELERELISKMAIAAAKGVTCLKCGDELNGNEKCQSIRCYYR